MDIYAQAKEMNADYYDWQNGRIFKIQEYNEAVKDDPSVKIRVTDLDGNTIGYALRRN